jgi:hypothetical protein
MIGADVNQIHFWIWRLGRERHERLLSGVPAVHEVVVPNDVGELADKTPKSYAKKSTGGLAPKRVFSTLRETDTTSDEDEEKEEARKPKKTQKKMKK